MAVRTGDVIFKCKPYVHILKAGYKYRCHFCVASSNELLTCSGCQILKYCNSECKKADWTLHRLECRCLQNFAPDCPADLTRLLLRLVIRMQMGDHRKMFEENKLFQRQFIDLMSHFKDLQSDGICYNKAEIEKCAKNCLDLPSHETLLEMFGKILINSFTIPDEYLASVGIGIYLSSSIMDHSCAPNAIIGYKGTEQIVYALTDISEIGPDKLFISYINTTYTSWQRRDRLFNKYYFHCQCSWCEIDSHYIDHIMTSALCLFSGCAGYTGLTRDHGVYKVLPCTSCGRKGSPDYEQMVLKMWTYGNECCDKLNKLEKDEDFEGVLSLAEKVLQEFDESIMYESNHLYIRVREYVIGACTELNLWEKAAEYGEKVWPQKMKCIPNVDYTTGLLLVELGKFYLNDHNIPEARRVFHDATNLVKSSHGLYNETYNEILDLMDQCTEIETLLTRGNLNDASVKKVFNRFRHRIRKVLPKRVQVQVPSLFRSHQSNNRKKSS